MSSYYEKMLATGEVKCIDEEVPFEVPQGWEWTRIGNIFNHTSGKQQSSSNKGGGTPQKFITTSNLYWGHFVLDNVKVMNFTDEEIKTCSATKGDLLVCEGGAGYGRSAIWNEDYDICLQNHVHRLRPCVSGICEYVYYFIYLLKESNNLASVGTAMPGLSANRLKGLLLPFPSLTEQMRIVLKLEGLLPQIDKYSKVQNQFDELNTTIKESLKKSILQEAIQGKLVPQLAEEGTAQELLEQIKTEKQKLVKEGKLKKSALHDSFIFRGGDNKYYQLINNKYQSLNEKLFFKIPTSWCWVQLRQVAIVARGGSPRPIKDYLTDSEDGINWIKIGDTEQGGKYINATKEKICPKGVSKSRFVHKGDFLLTNSMSFGRPYITNIDGCIHDGWLVISPFSNTYNQNFLYYLLSSNFAYRQFVGKVAGGVVKNLNSDKVADAIFPLPPLEEQQRIVAQIEKLFEQLH